MSLYYESHVTIEPVIGVQLDMLKQLCEASDFRVADLLMQKRPEDTPERSKFDTFCSGRGTDKIELASRMFTLVACARAVGLKVWRYKIEDVVIDSKIDDALFPLK